MGDGIFIVQPGQHTYEIDCTASVSGEDTFFVAKPKKGNKEQVIFGQDSLQLNPNIVYWVQISTAAETKVKTVVLKESKPKAEMYTFTD